MRVSRTLITLAALVSAASCDLRPTSLTSSLGNPPAFRIINAFTSPVDVLIDGHVAFSAFAPGQVNTAPAAPGNHTVVLRPTSGGTSISQQLASADGAVSTIAATVGTSGLLSTAVLDDTNSVVPSGATKLRVIHFAPNAGTLQVYRTQPDFPTPVSWQFPFNYQPAPTSLSAPFYQSTVGSWEVRIWQTPADASGWSTAPTRVTVPLGSGEKATILILDKQGGGVQVQVI